MKNKLKAILILALLAVTFAALSACTGGTAIDEYFSKGYQIKVTYDGNGGKFVGKEGNQLVDLYNPARYEADASNTVHIPLVVPTEREIAGEAVSITKAGYVVAGWYTEREIVKNTEGKVVDESGVAIDYVDGAYVYENGEPAEPAYTYGGHWDFASDTVDYVLGSGKKEVTLYACWVPYYQFNYYMRAGEEWKLVETSTFDYKTSKEKGLLRENVWIPSYVDGAMNYEHTYRVNGSTYTYTFPKGAENVTFDKAFTDPEMTDEITDVYTHGGTLDLETGKAENRVENIYFTVKQGTFYKISEAYQLGMNVDFYGDYEITADLDFSTDAWPAAFAFNEFKGKMYSTPGHVYKIINPTATFLSEDSEYGGLFGALTDASTVKDLVFENVTVRYEKCALRLRTAYFGVFAGYIDSDAAVENVTLTGTATLRLDGALPFERPTNENLISLSANGAAVKITDLSVPKVVVGGTRRGAKYRYGFDPETMVLSADGTITLHFDTYDLDEAEYEATLTPAAE